jgi:hypothetical protein
MPDARSARRAAAAMLVCIACANACADDTPASALEEPGRWSLGLETSYLFNTIPNPFFLLAGRRGKENRKNRLDYHLTTQVLGGQYRLSDVGGWRFLRGYWQFEAALIYSQILKGPETYWGGVMVGFRYNFAPRDSRWSPYVELRGGYGLTDASMIRYGQQQDSTFAYLLDTGVGYQAAPRWRVSAGVMEQHLSNFYQTHPNFGFDVMGFNLRVDRSF